MKKNLLSATTLFVIFIFSLRANAITFYWVGGTGNWNDINHWASTSGGTFHPSVPPDSTIDVVFDANSFPSNGASVTVNLMKAYCRNFDWTGVTNNPTFKRDTSFVNDSLMIYGSFILSAGMTWNYTGTNPYDCVVAFLSSSPGNIINMAGHTLSTRTVFGSQGSGGEWTLADDYNHTLTTQFRGGFFYTNGFTLNIGWVYCYYNSKVHLSTSMINGGYFFDNNNCVEPEQAIFNVDQLGAMTSTTPYTNVNCGYLSCWLCKVDSLAAVSVSGWNGTIKKAYIGVDSSANTSINSAGMHFEYVMFKGQNILINGSTATNPASILDTLIFDTPGSIISLSDTDTLIVSNLLLFNSTSGNNITFKSMAANAGQVFCGADTVCTNYLRIQNIHALGSAQFFAGANSTDLGSNTGWQFSPCGIQAVGYYWVGGTGNWSDLNHWATTSGGSVHPSALPDTTDDVFFDANSFTASGQVVSSNLTNIYCHNFDWTGVTNNPTFRQDTIAAASAYLNVHGSFILAPGINWQYGSYVNGCRIGLKSMTAGNIIKTAGITFFGSTHFIIGYINAGGSFNVADNFAFPGLSEIMIQWGNLNTNGFQINGRSVNIQPWGTAILGTSVINCNTFNGSSFGGSIDGTAATINCTTSFTASNSNYHLVNASTIYLSNANIDQATATTSLSGDSGSGLINIGTATVGTNGCTNCGLHSSGIHYGNAILMGTNFRLEKYPSLYHDEFDTLQLMTSGGIYTFTDTDTVVIHNSLIINSIPGGPVTLRTNLSTPFPITFMCGMSTVCADYVQLNNVRGGGATQYYAGANSVDLGGNSGWLFQPCVAAVGYYWVDGTGNWSDLNHWATTSGGSVHPAALPDTTDDVFFDANSFPAAGAVVKCDLSSMYCRNFDWTGVTNNPTFVRDIIIPLDTLNVCGSFILSPNMTWNYTQGNTNVCFLNFHSPLQGNIIDMAGHSFSDNLVIEFGAAWASGEWSLVSAYSHTNPGGLTNITSGTFNTNGMPINTGRIQFLAGVVADLSNSIINCSSFYEVGNSVNPAQAIVNCGTFHSLNPILPLPFKQVTATSFTECVFCNVEQLTTPYIWGNGGNIKKGYIGTDVTPNTKIYTNATHFENVICKGQTIAITKQDAPLAASDFDTLIFDTPGSIVSLADTDTLIINNLLLFNSTSGNNITMQSGTVNPAPIFCGADTVCTDYIRLQKINALGSAQFFAGANSTDLGNNAGWQFTACTNFTNVWPGDANYDLVATNLDILYIGIAFGDTGSIRAGATNNWVAQPCNDWSTFYSIGINMKHGDCDGNGVVDVADTVPVFLNYGLTHPARFASEEDQTGSVDPELSLNTIPDTVAPSGHVHVDISLGTNAIPVDSIYGIAFTLNYDVNVIDTDSISVDFTNSWLGIVGTNMIGFYYSNPSSGQLDFALTRTDHNNVFGGNGTIAAFDVVIVDNISTVTNSSLRLSNVTALTYDEYLLSLSKNNDSIVVVPPTMIQKYDDLEKLFSVYPSPASEKLLVTCHDLSMTGIELFDVTGQRVYKSTVDRKRAVINVAGFANGVYNLRCYSEKGVYNHRVEVIHR